MIGTRRSAAFVLALFAMQSALVRTHATDSQSGSDLSSSGLEQAWSLHTAGRGVAGDTKTGLIYAGVKRSQIVEIDSAGAIRRQMSLAASPIAPETHALRLAHFGGDRPTLLAFGTASRSVGAFDLDGNQLWTYPAPTGPGYNGIDDVNVVDLDGDGIDEVIVGFNGSGGLRVIDSKGQLVWQSNAIRSVWGVAGGDVFANGSPQVIATSAGELGGLVHVFSRDGTQRVDIRPGFHAKLVRAGRIPGTAGAAAVFAMGTSRGVTTVAALSGSGSRHWVRRLPSRVFAAWLAPRKPWLAIGGTEGAVFVLDTERGEMIGSVDLNVRVVVEVGWTAVDASGSPLLLTSGGGLLRAFRVTAKGR